MPAASLTARTQFTHLGLYSQRYGSFAGKSAIDEIDPRAIILTVAAETRTFTVDAEDRTIVVSARATLSVPEEDGHA